jgi:hypothetical protein
MTNREQLRVLRDELYKIYKQMDDKDKNTFDDLDRLFPYIWLTGQLPKVRKEHIIKAQKILIKHI